MKTFITIFLLAASLTGLANAQKNMAVGAGVVVSIPIGSFGDGAKLGFGGTGAFEFQFIPQLVGVAQIGYIKYSTKSDNVSYSTVPVLLGVKYFFVPAVGFYGIGQLGLNFFSVSTDIPTFSFGGTSYGGGSASGSSAKFTFAIGAGYEVPVSPTFSLDITGTFHIISNFTNIQLRAGGKVAL
ncbi:MAG TPA: outer membrane beta-barrel protein [Ignavibacteriaceae bacterium]|nr:outer membrane beta-barrel protein [Ignavibacteriaceae bacterium]